MVNLDNLQTGDILLFVEHPKNPIMKLFTWLITTATHSEYSHAAVVLKDPTFIHPSLKGLFLWESSWEGTPDPQDDKIKLGVQITPIYQFLQNYSGKIYVRRLLKGKDLIKDETLEKIHKISHFIEFPSYREQTVSLQVPGSDSSALMTKIAE